MDGDNFRQSNIIRVMTRLRNKKVRVVVQESFLKTKNFAGFIVIKNIVEFKRVSDLSITNRYSSEIEDIEQKLYKGFVLQRLTGGA